MEGIQLIYDMLTSMLAYKDMLLLYSVIRLFSFDMSTYTSIMLIFMSLSLGQRSLLKTL